MRNRLTLASLVTFEGAALWLAWAHVRVEDPIEWRAPLEWLGRVEPESALLALGRLGVIAISGWLLTTTVLGVIVQAVATARRVPRSDGPVSRVLARLTPAMVRRAVEAAVAVSIAAGTAPARPALAGPSRPPIDPVVAVGERHPVQPVARLRDGRTVAAPGISSSPRPAASPVMPSPPPPPAPSATPPPLAPPTISPGRAVHVIVPGENLWTIARDHLRDLGVPDDDATVARYWRTLCEANRASLRSGDVDLVHPGETLELPPVA
jgi:hypothetical protein